MLKTIAEEKMNLKHLRIHIPENEFIVIFQNLSIQVDFWGILTYFSAMMYEEINLQI